MTALGDARQAKQAAASERRRNCQAPASCVARQKGEGDQREAERSMARAERAVTLALARRNESRGELSVAAELDDLGRPRAPPMIFEDGVDEKAGAERKRKDKVESGSGIAAEQCAPGEAVASSGGAGKWQN